MSNNLIVGCSHVEGFELEEELGYVGLNYPHSDNLKIAEYRKQKRFAKVLADKLNTKFTVISKTGADNSWITYSAVQHCMNLQDKPKNVIVCLTGITRQQRFYKGKPYFLNPLYPGHAAELNKGRNNKDVDNIVKWEQAEHSIFLDINYYLLQTYHYVNYLKSYFENNNINYFILKSIENSLDLKEFTDNTLNFSFMEYATMGKFPKAKNGHFLSQAHKSWGEYIFDQLGDRFIK